MFVGGVEQGNNCQSVVAAAKEVARESADECKLLGLFGSQSDDAVERTEDESFQDTRWVAGEGREI